MNYTRRMFSSQHSGCLLIGGVVLVVLATAMVLNTLSSPMALWHLTFPFGMYALALGALVAAPDLGDPPARYETWAGHREQTRWLVTAVFPLFVLPLLSTMVVGLSVVSDQGGVHEDPGAHVDLLSVRVWSLMAWSLCGILAVIAVMARASRALARRGDAATREEVLEGRVVELEARLAELEKDRNQEPKR